MKRTGIRKSLFGPKVRALGAAFLKPWVLAHIEVKVDEKTMKDAALVHIDRKGQVKKIIYFWSEAHFEQAYKSKIKTDSKKQIEQALVNINKGYNDNDTLWKSDIKKMFIIPPYSIHHVEISDSKTKKVLTERIVFRKYENGKIGFTINFVGAEEHRIHLLESFYKENPLFSYQFFE